MFAYVDASTLGGVVIEPRITDQLAASSHDYKQRFAAFFHLVREHQSYDLAFLAFRLDFNEYYESLELARKAAEGDGDDLAATM